MSEAADFWEPETNDPAPDRVRKVSISLPEALLQRARRHVGRGSLSHYVAGAVEARLRQDDLDDWLDEMLTKHGPIPQEIKDEVAAQWAELGEKFRAQGY